MSNPARSCMSMLNLPSLTKLPSAHKAFETHVHATVVKLLVPLQHVWPLGLRLAASAVAAPREDMICSSNTRDTPEAHPSHKLAHGVCHTLL
jgi:hypothetical protein